MQQALIVKIKKRATVSLIYLSICGPLAFIHASLKQSLKLIETNV